MHPSIRYIVTVIYQLVVDNFIKEGGGIEMVEQQVIIDSEVANEQSDAVKARPVFKTKIGAFSSAVFLDEVNGRNLPSVVIEKSFTADGKSWKHYKLRLLNAAEVDKLICVLQDTKRALYTEDFQ